MNEDDTLEAHCKATRRAFDECLVLLHRIIVDIRKIQNLGSVPVPIDASLDEPEHDEHRYYRLGPRSFRRRRPSPSP